MVNYGVGRRETYIGEGKVVFTGLVWHNSSFFEGSRDGVNMHLFVVCDVLEICVVIGFISSIDELLLR